MVDAKQRAGVEGGDGARRCQLFVLSCWLSGIHKFNQDDLLLAVDFVELDLDDLPLGGGNRATGERGLDGEFAVSTVDED